MANKTEKRSITISSSSFLNEIYSNRSFLNDRKFKKRIKSIRQYANDESIDRYDIFNSIAKCLIELEHIFMYNNTSKSEYGMWVSLNTKNCLELNARSDDILVNISCDKDKSYEYNESMSDAYAKLTGSELLNSYHYMVVRVTRVSGNQETSVFEYIVNSVDNSNFRKQINSSRTNRMLIGLAEDCVFTIFCNILEHYYYDGIHRKSKSKKLCTDNKVCESSYEDQISM